MKPYKPTNQYEDTTEPLTLWSSTVMDLLIDDLKQERPDNKIKATVKELYRKQVHTSKIVRAVHKTLGQDAAIRLKNLIMRKS